MDSPLSLVPMKGEMISDHKAKRLAVRALTFSVVRRCLKAECTVSVQAALRVAKLCLLLVAYN